MNNVVELKGKRFVQANKNGSGGGVNMNGKKTVTASDVLKLSRELEQLKVFWSNNEKPFNGALVSVYYNKIVAKSNRIAGLLKGKKSNLAIVGAKFNDTKTKHIITYYVDMKDLDNSIKLLQKVYNLLKDNFENGINQKAFKDNNTYKGIPFSTYELNKSKFKQAIADVSFIDDFDVKMEASTSKESIITLYDTGVDVKELLHKIGIDILSSNILDNQTVFLDVNQVDVLFKNAPYLVSMATVDLSQFSPEDFDQKYNQDMIQIPSPSIEPTIGVIDTLFDKRVYFGEWVDYHDMVDNQIPKKSEDYRHGTAVSSIIVDGPRLNPWLDDGCGRFKVRHFGVAVSAGFSSFSIVKNIKRIVAENRDIKVWNISLGSNQEVNDNFISAEAAALDQIQFENDVIFVIAGTNRPNNSIEKIGSPADSINSIVVNSVTKDGTSPKYARRGLALSFFAKPDVSYYGGSKEQYISVCEPLQKADVAGTSYAAPWIARKLSYLIDILGLSREVAKALIIDSARGWKKKPTPEEIALYGHGIVPIKIEEVIQCEDDEIRFVVSDISEKWNSYNYNFPVPLQDDKYPYVARATMCYFPLCNRLQGADYTNTELNIHFGRINNEGKLNEINYDKQNLDNDSSEERHYILEGVARERFRKWDNVKYVTEVPKSNNKAKISYTNKNWGIEVKTNNRLDPEDGIGIRFGIVVTLKEINGINRMDEFIRNCNLNGWLVNTVDIKNRIDIHEKVNEEIVFN